MPQHKKHDKYTVFTCIKKRIAYKYVKHSATNLNTIIKFQFAGIILCIRPANERWRYTVTPSLIGWAHIQNDTWVWHRLVTSTSIHTGWVDSHNFRHFKATHFKHIEAETRWPAFSRHFHTHFLEWKCMNFDYNFKKFVLRVLKGPVNSIPTLVQIMAWRRPGDKPLSEPMMVSLLMHICGTRPQWVNSMLLYTPSMHVLPFFPSMGVMSTHWVIHQSDCKNWSNVL